MKKFSKCKKQKANNAYNKHPTTADGLAVWCKDCYNHYYKVRNEKKRNELKFF